MTLGEKIHRLRQDKNWSQDELGQKIGISRRFIGSYESGKSLPSATTLRRLAETFGVSIDYLMAGEGDTSQAPNDANDQTWQVYLGELQNVSEADQQAVKTVLEAIIFKNKMAGKNK